MRIGSDAHKELFCRDFVRSHVQYDPKTLPWPELGGPALDRLRAHGLTGDSTLVDLGAGTGRFALAAARLCRRVVAVDVSPAMLTHLREQAAQAGADNLECVRAGFLSYEHSGPPADAVYTRHALHQLPDFFKALALQRIADLLRPGGILLLRDLVYDFHPAQAPEVMGRWFANAAADPATGYTSQDYADHVRTEFSTFRWLLEPMLDAAGFDIADVEFAAGLFGAYTCVKR